MTLRHRHSFMLYSSRDGGSLADQAKTLAGLGYTNVETFPDLHADPAAARATLDAAGLAITSAHFDVADITDATETVIATARSLGASFVVAPWLEPEDRPADAAGWQALAARLSTAAATLAEAGLTLCWHNHDFEFDTLPDGSLPMEHLAAAPGLKLELDAGWLVRCGQDPMAWLERLGTQVRIGHVKDVAAPGTTAEDGWADPGHGIAPWAAIWDAFMRHAQPELMIVEHDEPSDWTRFARNAQATVARLAETGVAS